MTSTQVTRMKKRPPKIAVPRIARGMSRRGSRASSPSVAAASNPAKERNPNTTPRKSADGSVPLGTENGLRVRPRPPGALPAASRTTTTSATSRMSSTVPASMTSRVRVPRRTGATVST
jgi:hypothetical protein